MNSKANFTTKKKSLKDIIFLEIKKGEKTLPRGLIMWLELQGVSEE